MATTKKKSTEKAGGVSAAAVRKATGKDWKQWFALLNKAGAQKLDHKGIVAWLAEHHADLGGWWTQMVTVAYEVEHGLRAKHEKPGGFEISGSRTVAVPLAKLYGAFADARARRRWLADPGWVVRKATPNKSLRITWVDGETSVNANFYAKGRGKSQVTLQHGKLPNARAAERKKKYWSENLGRLKETLEG